MLVLNNDYLIVTVLRLQVLVEAILEIAALQIVRAALGLPVGK